MGFQIEDGTGNGNLTAVSSSNRMKTVSYAIPSDEFGPLEAISYNIDPGILTLTSANESAILYGQNLNILPMRIIVIRWTFGQASTNGDVITRFYTNPTGGTIVSSALKPNINNRNLGSLLPPIGNFYKGGEGYTITGGSVFGGIIYQSATANDVEPYLVLPTGSSFCLTVQPPTGNTSMKTWTFAQVDFLDPTSI